MYIIYRLTCEVTGKCYIGQTKQLLQRRFYQHCWEAKQGSKTALHNAIIKYGKDNFSVECLHENVSIDKVDALEVSEIERHNSVSPNGYNLDSGGSKNKVTSAETRAKVSRGNKGKVISETTRKKISIANTGKKNWMYGRTHTPEARAKISATHKGKTISSEQKKQISEFHKGRWVGEKNGMWGKKHSAETKRKYSENRKGKRTGKESHLYGRKISKEERERLNKGLKEKCTGINHWKRRRKIKSQWMYILTVARVLYESEYEPKQLTLF